MLKSLALASVAAVAAIATPAMADLSNPCASVATGHNCFVVALTGTNPYSVNIGNTVLDLTGSTITDDYYFLLPSSTGLLATFGGTTDNGNTVLTGANFRTAGSTSSVSIIPNPGFGYMFQGTVNASDTAYSRFSIAYNAAAGNTASYGGTISFTASSPAPEAATWSMMIAGFGLVGGALRSRKVKAVLA